MAQVTARYGRRAGDGSARFTLISPCYYAGSSCRSRSWARCRWFTVLLLLLLLPLLPPPPPLPPLLQGLARGLCRWLGSLQGASARGGEAEGDQGSRRQQDRSASPPRCDMSCAAWPHVHDCCQPPKPSWRGSRGTRSTSPGSRHCHVRPRSPTLVRCSAVPSLPADADAPALGLSPLWHWLRVPSVCVLVADALINRVPEQRYAEILRKVAAGRGLQLSCAVLVP